MVCDLNTDGGGWIVFQRRFDGSQDFYQNWESYKHGFGDLTHEHWLGLEKIHKLTSHGRWQLRIDLEDFSGNTAYALYDNFKIDDESANYRLRIGFYSGTLVEGLIWHANMAFSTYDWDNDPFTSDNCAVVFHGAWWYNGCYYYRANLNGRYIGSPVTDYTGMMWRHWNGRDQVLKKSEMKMRRMS